MGIYVRKKLKKLSKKYKIKLNIWGSTALVRYTIKNDKENYIKTYITEEMLKNGFLFGNCIYICINHTKQIMDKYFNILEKIFEKLSKCKKVNEIKDLLDGPVSHSTFKRLN